MEAADLSANLFQPISRKTEEQQQQAAAADNAQNEEQDDGFDEEDEAEDTGQVYNFTTRWVDCTG